MATYNGEYQVYIESDYYNEGNYLDLRVMRTRVWDYRQDNIKELFLKSGMIWEAEVKAGEVPVEVRIKVKASTIGLLKVMIVDGDVVVDSAENSKIDEWEELILTPSSKSFIIRLICKYSAVNIKPVGYFKELMVVVGDTTYERTDDMSGWELADYVEEAVVWVNDLIISEGIGAGVGILEEGGGGGGDEEIRVEDMAIRMGVGWDDVKIDEGWQGGTIWLGPVGGEIALPEINWVEGSEGRVEVEYGKKINLVDVINGGRRAWVRERTPKRWRFGWDDLSLAEMEVIKGLYENGEELMLRTNRDDDEWRRVVMSDFQVRSKEERIARGEYRFGVEIELEEIVEEG